MTKLLLKTFVKDYENIKEPKVRESYGKFAGAVGIVSNIILCVMKVLVGVIAGSIAIISDGINNLADASSSVITLIGFKLASKPETSKHPYGHARIEYLTGLLVSALIIIVGVSLLKSSFAKVLAPELPDFSTVTIIVLVIAIAIKAWQAGFNISLGKKINSQALIATGTDSRNDVISTTVVLISVLVGKFTGLAIDGYMGCLVALFIIWSGISLVLETSSPLLGEAPDEELVQEIGEIVENYEGVLGIHDLMVHNYGPGKIFVSIHIEVDSRGDIMESHDMIDRIEMKLNKELHIHATAHMDPIDTQNPERKAIEELLNGLIKDMDGVYGLHDLRMVPGPTHTNVIFDVVLAPECKLTQNDIRIAVNDCINRYNENYFAVINFDKAYTNFTKKEE